MPGETKTGAQQKKPRRLKRMSVAELKAALTETEEKRSAEIDKVNTRFDRWREKYEAELRRREDLYAGKALEGAVRRMIGSGRAEDRLEALQALAGDA